jgi:hypothetical protein
MSFNLSSDEEDENKLEELWTKAAADNAANRGSDDDEDDNPPFFFATESPAVAAYPSAAKAPGGFQPGDGDESDEGSVDWEDSGSNHGEDDMDQKLPAKPLAKPLQAVTIDLGSNPRTKKGKAENENKAKNKTRKRYRYGSLPKNFQSLLKALHRAHWLSLNAHITYISAQCSNTFSQSVAYSLLPVSWIESESKREIEEKGYKIPLRSELENLFSWYFDLVHMAEERRLATLQANLAAGAPRQLGRQRRSSNRHKRKHPEAQFSVNGSVENRVCSTYRLLNYCKYLSSSLAEDPQLLQEDGTPGGRWSASDRVCLFIALVRSLGWRARYVAAIDPIRKDLDMDHPMLTGAMTNIFQAVSLWSKTQQHEKQGDNESKSSGRKRRKQSGDCIDLNKNETLDSDTQTTTLEGQGLFGWVEVLCRIDTNTGKQGSNRKSH